MCLLVVANKFHPTYPLVLVANRDEYYDRPTAPAHFWDDAPELLAGKDLKGGGTWLGITRFGRVAAITNYRDPLNQRPGAPSRGMLVRDFLLGKDSPIHFLESLKNKAGQYNGFNIIVGDMTNLYWYSNKGPGIIALKRGVFGLSNHLLDTPWPKVLRAKQMLLDLLSSDGLPPDEAFFNLLLDQTKPQDSELPDTGVGLERERILSPIFISSPVYGTRSSTLIFVDTRGNVRFVEKTHDPGAPPPTLREFQFTLDSGS